MTLQTRSKHFYSLFFSSLLLLPSLTWGNSLDDTHRFRVGASEQNLDVTGSVTRKPFPEVEIDFDNLLGVSDSSTTYFLSYQWRFKDKWALRTSYSQLHSSGDKFATKTFNYDGEEYLAGTLLETDFELDTLLVAVNYSLLRDDKKELGVGFGLHAFNIDTTIAATVGIDGVVGQGVKSTNQLLAPLPNLRAFGTYMVTPKWEISAAMGWLSFAYDDYDGDYLYLTAFTEYRFTDRFGVGFSYQVSEIDVSHEDNKGSEAFDIDLYGPSLYLTYGF